MKDGVRSGPGAWYGRRVAHAAAGVAAAAVALALVAGCGGSSSDGSAVPQATLPTGLPTGLPTDLPTDLPTALSSLASQIPDIAKVPENFPIPPGAEKDVTEVGGGETLTLTGVSAEDAFAYYRTALPKAGYEITSDNATSFGGAISFKGKDVQGVLSGADVLGESAVAIAFTSRN